MTFGSSRYPHRLHTSVDTVLPAASTSHPDELYKRITTTVVLLRALRAKKVPPPTAPDSRLLIHPDPLLPDLPPADDMFQIVSGFMFGTLSFPEQPVRTHR